MLFQRELTVRSRVQKGISVLEHMIDNVDDDEKLYDTTSQAAPSITASSNKTAGEEKN